MSTKKNTAPTVHGSIEYETVECSSCGQDVMKEEARRVYVGDVKGTTNSSHRGVTEVEFDRHDHTSGWFCPHCYDEPVGFVAKVRSTTPTEDAFFVFVVGVIVGISLLGFLLSIP